MITIWDPTGAFDPLPLRGHAGTVCAVTLTPDGRLLSVGQDGTVRRWDVGGPFDPTIARPHDGLVHGGHAGMTMDVAFAPDGWRLASLDAAGTVRIWDRLDGQPVAVDLAPTGSGAAFSPDGERVATGHSDGSVRIWSCDACGPVEKLLAAAATRATRPFTPDERHTFLLDGDAADRS